MPFIFEIKMRVGLGRTPYVLVHEAELNTHNFLICWHSGICYAVNYVEELLNYVEEMLAWPVTDYLNLDISDRRRPVKTKVMLN
jgi:hypothetical protein